MCNGERVRERQNSGICDAYGVTVSKLERGGRRGRAREKEKERERGMQRERKRARE